MVSTQKTELLFLVQMLRILKTGGRAAVIVPDGVLFGSSKAHKAVRALLVDKHKLDGVVSMPSGVFKPYAGVSTAVLLFTKTGTGGTENYGHDIEWIKTDNITDENHDLTPAAEYLSSEGRALAREVGPGAVLMACIAGSLSSIAKVAIADREVCFNQQINALQPTRASTPFLFTLLKVGQRKVQDASTGGMKGMVSKGRLSKIAFMLPPAVAQQRFDGVFERYRALRRHLETGADEADTLFHALVQRAFRGEL